MTTLRTRLLVLAVGLLTAGPASAATLSVYAKMSGSNAVGHVVTASGTSAISCFTNSPTGCVDAAAVGTVVLQPDDATGTNATFVSWTGCGALDVTGRQCTLDLTTAKTVTARFAAATQTLTVKTYPVKTATYTPPYGGRVQAATTPAIDCKSTYDAGNCTAPAAYNTNVVLTAVPDAVSKVVSWSGCASSTATTCTVAMNASKVVSATFGSRYIPVSAAVSGPGIVRVSESAAVPDGMLCPGDCTAGATGTGTSTSSGITLTAIADAGAKFVGWTGACTGASTSCSITNANLNNPAFRKEVTATFKGVGCGTCHSQPLSHLPYSVSCGDCHAGYTSTTVAAATHMNNTVDLTPLACEQPAADFGVSFEIVGAGVVQNAGAANDRAYVDVKVSFDGGATFADLPAAITAGEFHSGTGATGTSRVPRFAFGQVLADGSFKSVLVTSAGAMVTSQTATAAQLAAQPDGVYRFTFSTSALAQEGLDLTQAYRAVMYGARYFKPAANPPLVCASTQFPTSDYFDFVPVAGGTPATPKETVTDAACNACHGKLTLHGMRRGVSICLTCHNASTPLGSGNTDAFKWDLRNLVHKLHSGMNYDGLNPLTGIQGTSWGSSLDASHMAMGPSHTTYFEGAGTATTTTADDAIHDLPTQIECKLCHSGANATNYLVASQAGCSSCHPINWATGSGHGSTYPTAPGYPHTDAECAGCHPQTGPVTADFVNHVYSYPVGTVHGGLWEPQTGYDFGQPVVFSGTTYPAVPVVDGVRRHKLEINVTGFSVNATSGKATILFTALLDGAPYQTLLAARTANLAANTFVSADVYGGRFPTCAFQLAGPANTDYVVPANGSTNLSCGAADATNGSQVVAVNAANGEYSVTPTTNLNTLADGVYTLAYEMMYSRQAGNADNVTDNADDAIVRKPFAAKPSFTSVTKAGTAFTFGTTAPRRAVVAFEKCNACHVQLGFHSNRGRQGPDYCATCHNPMLDNATRDRVKFADARNFNDPAYVGYTTATSGKVYLTESVSLNVFIHRIHMGGDLPSVQNLTQASPWVPEPGRIFYGATRSAFVGTTATTAPEFADLTEFAMPNPMGRCDQCHLAGTWALPASAERAAVRRTFRVCAPVTPSWATEQWCNNTSTSGPAAAGTLITPPLKAVCTSCHDDVGTNVHADQETTNPMSLTAVEKCADCHGAGKTWDVVKMHPAIP